MSKFTWIDLNEAATRLGNTPEDVRGLIDNGVLGARTFDGIKLVVRSDEIARLAELFATVRRSPDRRPVWRRDRVRP